jgi:hypothetical protein
MAKLTIKRKPYHRKAYTRKDGTHVKASSVGSATFKVKDRGKPGRTPRSEQFYHPKVHTGWHKGDSLSSRRAKVLKTHKGDKLSSGRAMQALANVTTDPATRREARKDAKYFFGGSKA